MKFSILLAAVVGYHVQDVWDFFLIYMHYRPTYPGMIVQVIFSPGWLFFRSRLFVGLTNALVYGAVAYLVLIFIAKSRRTPARASKLIR